MSVLNENQLLGAPAGSSQYQIQRSIRLNAPDSAYLSRTPASAGNRKTWTWSGWVKRSTLGAAQPIIRTSGSPYVTIQFASNDTLEVYSNGGSLYLIPSAVFRDVSAWLHLLVAVDTTAATSTDRCKVYINGSQVTAFSTATYPTQNLDTSMSDVVAHNIGGLVSAAYYLSGYLADIHFIDGQALTPSSFGETDANGEWQPKAYTGTYGTNGFKLNFSNNSAATATTLGADSSGNGNNWTPNNLSVTAGAGNDSLVDTPTSYGTDTGVGGEVRGNYCTWNSLDKGSQVVATDGNLQITGGANYHIIRSTVGISSGKWYYELTVVTKGAGDVDVGIAKGGATLTAYLGSDSNGWSYGTTGNKYNNGSGSAYGAAFTAGDVIGVAFDADAGTLTFYKNGTTQGQAFSGLTAGPYFFAIDATSGVTTAVNFGQRPFAYPVSGFKALLDTSLPAPTIVKPSTVMDVKLYTGNGSTQTISGLGFSPDLVWVKSRSTVQSHVLTDAVRGTSSQLFSNLTDAQGTQTDQITALNSDGFSLGSNVAGTGGVNTNSVTYAAWCWDAGSSTVTNTAGTISSQVRANASAGFSIVTYTGTGANATVGHGLGVAPQFYVVKNRSVSGEWYGYHVSSGAGNYLLLNTTAAATASTTVWNNTAPSSTVFSLGASSSNTASSNFVAYCFAPVAGYSAFGSYTGNGGSADGPFIYTGFRPRWLLIKAATTTALMNWVLIDAARDTYNQVSKYFYANTSGGEGIYGVVDFLSNGFKLTGSSAETNASGATHIYAAFAEFPFQYARAR